MASKVRVKLLSARAGSNPRTMEDGSVRQGGTFLQRAGDIVEVDKDEAKRMIASGGAEPVGRSTPENTVGRSATRKAVTA